VKATGLLALLDYLRLTGFYFTHDHQYTGLVKTC
jgi:hypothetical protein